MKIEEAIEILKNSKCLYLKEKIDSDILEEAIKTLLTAYEKQQKELKDLKDIQQKICNEELFEKDYVEKLQKEIEELKKQDLSNSKIIANMSERHFHDREKIRKYEALQDKIKAKIEELEREKEKYFEKQVIQHEIEVLKLLLEKE